MVSIQNLKFELFSFVQLKQYFVRIWSLLKVRHKILKDYEFKINLGEFRRLQFSFKLESVTHKSCVHIITMLCRMWHIFLSQRIGIYVLIGINAIDEGMNLESESVYFLICLIDEYE